MRTTIGCAMRVGAGLIASVVLLTAAQSEAEPNTEETIKLVASAKLPNVPGKSVSAVVVSYEPGGKSVKHHHAGSVLVYVLSGEIRSENSATGPAKVYKAGESFFEPPGSEHLVSENASAAEPASLLAIFIADDGAELTTFDK
ncbi:MAG: cupin domain-containing protein [Methyloceanibacter sp.]